jgi:hypothetical protein
LKAFAQNYGLHQSHHPATLSHFDLLQLSMKQAIEDITQRLQQRLPDQHAYYSPAELTEAGFPDFIVQRIRLGLSQRLERSIAPPRVEWADAGVGDVEVAWRQFSTALHANVRLPRKHADKLLNEAVTDVLFLLCEPREFLPRYLFGNDSSLSQSQVRERIPWIVVYPQLGQFLPKYMRARELKEITRARYENALRQLDDKLVQAYQPADWLTLLNPLFVLFDGQIPTSLIRRFFEDKARYGLAERIGEHQEEHISRGMLLGFLSPARTDVASPENDEKVAIQAPSAKQDSETKTKKEENKTQSTEKDLSKSNSSESGFAVSPEADESKAGEEREPHAADIDNDLSVKENGGSGSDEKKDETKTESPVQTSPPEREENESEVDSESKETADPERESATDSEEGISEKSATAENESTSSVRKPLYARFSEGQPGQKKASKEEQRQASKQKLPAFKAPQQSGQAGNESRSEQNVPLWKRLSEQSQNNTEKGVQLNETGNKSLGQKSTSKLPDDLNSALKKETKASRESGKLRAFLADSEKDYITELFKEDAAAYAQAIEALAGFRNWREAGKYLTNNIFRKSGINMYSNTAIEFTDSLHNYFKNHRISE